MKDFSITPRAMVASLWSHRHLCFSLVKHEILSRYRGSVLGVLWSLIQPIFMLAVYTFVFGVIFRARWGSGEDGSTAEFALILFIGLLIFNLFAECITRAPSLILSNPTYVKKIVFPLEILPWICFGAALYHTAISLVICLFFSLVIFGLPTISVLLLPLLLLPLLLFIMGFTWFLASLGVYLRDVSQIIGVVVTGLLFLSGIFFPISAIPEAYQSILYLNPLLFIIEQARDLIVFGEGLAWRGYIILTLYSLIIAWLGFAWFQKTRKGFADVI